MRDTILEYGGEFIFDQRVTDIQESFGNVRGVTLANGSQLTAEHVILATGHSARDIFELFRQKNWLVEAKAFALGIEQQAFRLGGGNLVAPAQRMVDFVEKRVSKDLPSNSYKPGTGSVDLDEVLPDFVYKALRGALPVFGKKMKGYYTNEAILVGVESRTSSPVRIPRDKETLQHPQIKGLYPCGEGAGYAGGIVSAAIDGINCVNAISLL
ncbi:hypothetical protein FQR65_LT16440 [Abscondita terminalis]|nr:hypothetical protein FQR65_LT16440 [Abscondita terminalis]